MKNLKVISAVIMLFTAFTFTSCSDVEPIDPSIVLTPDPGPNPNPNPNPGGSGQFKVDFDGQTYVATTVQAIVNADYIAITAIRGANAELFQITIPNPSVGTYTWTNVPAGEVFALAYSPGNGSSAFVSTPDDSGEFASYPEYVDTAVINITEIDLVNETISGTFAFTGARFPNPSSTAIETKVFTNGSFTDISYADDVPSPTGNSFTAKLDGEVFTPTNIFGSTALGKISIVGRRGTIENITVAFPDDVTPGTYELDMFGDHTGMYILNNSSDGSGTFSVDSGTLTIISHNTTTNKVKGTFSFEASSFFGGGEHSITEGTFDVTY